MENILEQLTKMVQSYSEQAIMLLPKVATAIVVIFIGLIVSGKIKVWTTKLLNSFKMEATLVKFLSKLASWLFIFIVFLICLGLFGINVTGFATVVGGLTVAIGLAFQGTLSNFAAGLMLLIFRPYKVGDFVKMSGELGTVSELGIFSTSVNTLDNRAIILPNSLIFGQKIENLTANTYRRVDVLVGTAYGADIQKTRTVLDAVASSTKNAVRESDNKSMLLSLGDSSVNWRVMVWCKTADYWNVWEDVTQRTKDGLDQAGISIPFPQMRIHWDGNDKPSV